MRARQVRRALLTGLVALAVLPLGSAAIAGAQEGGEADARSRDIIDRTRTLIRRVESISGDVRTAETPEQVQVALATDVLFAFDSADLAPAAQARLAEVAATLDAEGEGPVEVVGHTDSMGTDAYNNDLSQRRAAAVRDALAQLAPDFTYQASGRGEAEPVAPNEAEGGGDDPDGRARNRRVEITFAKKA